MQNKEPTERFTDRVEDYVRYRPHYPKEMVPLLRQEIGLDPSWLVADIGSGTGFSTDLFLENGNVVFAVEPNAAMRRTAERLLAAHPRFKSVNGTAEATGLPAHCVDLVTAGQAFHWFDQARSRTEFRRILKTAGWILLFWNSRRTDSSLFLEEYEELLLRHGTDYQRVRHDKTTANLLQSFFGGNCRRQVLPNEQLLDFEGLKGRLLSASYTPAEGNPARKTILEELQVLFQKHALDGRARMEYETELWIGR